MVHTDSQFRVEIGIITPHNDREVTFISPAIGPNTYVSVGNEVRGRGLLIPTAEETMALVHAVYCGPERFRKSKPAKGVCETVRNHWLAVPNLNLLVGEGVGPAEGVYVVADPEMKGRGLEFTVEELAEKIKEGDEVVKGVRASRDGTVRFAQRNSYTFGFQKRKAEKNGFVIASYLSKGAQQVAEISQAIDKDVYAWGLAPGKGKQERRVSALYELDDGLYIDGDCWDASVDSFVFGVRV